MEEKTKEKSGKGRIFLAILLIIIVIVLTILLLIFLLNKSDKKESIKGKDKDKEEITDPVTPVTSKYELNGGQVEDFDLYFLQLENKKENKIYSPLSIKYALLMLNEGANGNSKAQISSVVGKYNAKKYTNNSNMSFANAIFIRDSYRQSIKPEFTNKLYEKYNAEIIYDSFETPNAVNTWVSDKTLGLIKNLLDDIDDSDVFMLVNALGIDMDWESKFVFGGDTYVSYAHEKFGLYGADHVTHGKFENNNSEIATMEIFAAFNNYDIIKELGEDNIRKTVGDEYRKYLKENPYYLSDTTDAGINNEINRYLDEYINEIKMNYGRENKSTGFYLYTNDNIKTFAKDLKTYGDTTLQYVAIMPNGNLDEYIKGLNAQTVNDIIKNLKELRKENFKDGVVTKITGSIPKFKFEYNLDLMNDLKALGIEDIFDQNKADLSSLTNEKNVFIGDAVHKANIEFTQDGIKASAATMMGGLGTADFFDYLYDVPVEEIDLTFNRPYMFIIRDKATNEVWFAGTVYNPQEWSQDPDYQYYNY